MKKLSFTILLSVLCINLISAQGGTNQWDDRNSLSDNQWTLGFGVNTVNNSDAVFKDLTNTDHWAFNKIPFYVSAEASVANKLRLGAMLSFNYTSNGTVYEGQTILGPDEGGNDAGYTAFDVSLKYSFLSSDAFEPYLSVGPGITHWGDYITQENPTLEVSPLNTFTLNAGFGCNIWFSSTWGINLNATGKWGVAKEYTNHHQASAGILYSIN